MGLIGAVPFVGKALAQQYVGINHPGLKAQKGWPIGGYVKHSSPGQTKVNPQKMSPQNAWKILLQNKEMKDEYTSTLYRQYKDINQIDPDLDVYKSFSRMAKITFQRQRHVQRTVESHSAELNYGNGITDKLQNFIHKLVWGE
jgi:hypothetical protein